MEAALRISGFLVKPEGSKRWWRKPRSVRAVLKSGQGVSLPLDLDGLDEVAFVAARLNAALAKARGQSDR